MRPPRLNLLKVDWWFVLKSLSALVVATSAKIIARASGEVVV